MGETFQTIQYDAAKKYFNNIGGLLGFEGKTKSYTPEDLVSG
jgi:hypothetical protein